MSLTLNQYQHHVNLYLYINTQYKTVYMLILKKCENRKVL